MISQSPDCRSTHKYMYVSDRTSTLSVLYNKDVCPTSSIVWSTTFPFNIFKSHQTTQNTIISFLFSIPFYFTDIKFYIYYVHYYVFIYYYYYPALGALNISFY